ncbi:U-box domain-containing protein 4 [Amborella trichopoda]|uniref:RING-type E3 ubiquitin transferase n=1 Tax=Amborella trichopoda TaxID=13333 RepID=W1P4B4_AMBTC|nr:U-box domain-containing protein 4 [Amborella trichopoda]ERN02753.1 hypothetical protein AMTR_s00086p00031680 [Amborella trichopoda]|eukprot:XP_020520878.1 U-box domain-containing protein 4 [Amborella trichopoda]
MGTDIPVSAHEYMRRRVVHTDPDSDHSLAFSDYNSDRSGEFSSTCPPSRTLLAACAADNSSDDALQQLVVELGSLSVDEQRRAAMEVRLLAKHKRENRLKLASAGAVKPLVALVQSPDPQVQEYGVTALLNLSLCDENKDLIAAAGAVKPLVRALRDGSTAAARENAACALLRLGIPEENRAPIGCAGAIEPLVNLLALGSFRGKKDAAAALFTLCSVRENKLRAVKAGAVKPLIEYMADFSSGMLEKAALVLDVLVGIREAKAAVVEEGGIPVLVEIIEVGSHRQKEFAVGILLQLCEESSVYRTLVAREGAIPPLVALSQNGTTRARQKAETLIPFLRQPRSGFHRSDD